MRAGSFGYKVTESESLIQGCFEHQQLEEGDKKTEGVEKRGKSEKKCVMRLD